MLTRNSDDRSSRRAIVAGHRQSTQPDRTGQSNSRSRSLSRRLLSVVPLVIAVGSVVQGCGVPADGLTGVARDTAGHLVVVLAWCGHAPNGVTIYHDNPSNTNDPNIVDDSFRAPALHGNTAVVNIDQPAGGWTRTAAQKILSNAVEYSAYGWTSDNSYSTRAVDFKLSTVAALKPGQVLFQDTKTNNDLVASQDDFVGHAAKLCS